MKSKIATVIGIVVLVIGAGALLLTCRDLVLSIRFGGPSGGALGDYNFSKMLVDGALTLIFGGVGVLLTRQHLQRQVPRTILVVITVIVILLGLNAGRIS